MCFEGGRCVSPSCRSRTGPASPRRLVCAPREMSAHCTADQAKEQTMNSLFSLLSRYTKSLPRRNRTPRNRPSRRLRLEPLEDRAVPAAVAPPSGLVSWWTADNSAADLKGLNNATLYNGTTYAAGEVQQAFSFDGVNDRAELGDPDSLKFTASMSIEGWIQVRGYEVAIAAAGAPGVPEPSRERFMQVTWRDLYRSSRRRRTGDGQGLTLTGGPRGHSMGGVPVARPN